jgi:hypothetical protein
MRSVMFVAIAAVVACGPSSAEIKTARTSMYVGPPEAMFKTIIDTTAETYKIADAHRVGEDELANEYELITEGQWYNPEGGRQSAGAGDFVQLVDRSIQLSLIVQLTQREGNRYLVTVTPKTFQHVSGSPKPRELAPDDPNLPGWVQGRVDTLQFEIHKRLQNYATK